MPEITHRGNTLQTIDQNRIHQSLVTPTSFAAITRAKISTMNDPAEAMKSLREILQASINDDIKKVMNKYAELYFYPAVKNARRNLGQDKVNNRLVEDTCIDALEEAKSLFSEINKSRKSLKRKLLSSDDLLGVCEDNIRESNNIEKKTTKIDKLSKPNTDILVSKTGKPLLREGSSWEPNSLSIETKFILGSRANKALGLGQTRGRLYIKHPELFKYSGDQEDKEWLVQNNIITTTGGKVYLMILSDIKKLASSQEYSSSPKQKPNELTGFNVPFFIIEKMKRFASILPTVSTDSDNELLKKGEEQVAKWDEERKKNISLSVNSNPTLKEEPMINEDLQSILEGLKEGGLDEVEFLHGINFNNLVKELETTVPTGNGSKINILSMTDEDNVDEDFPELAEVEEESTPSKSSNDLIDKESSDGNSLTCNHKESNVNK